MKYKILCWIPAEADEPEIYDTEIEARVNLRSLKFMQPENKYEIQAVG